MFQKRRIIAFGREWDYLPKKTNRTVVTAGLLAALFIGALDVTVVSTAMPQIMTDLQGLSLISWIFSIYTLTTCVTTPIFGKLADLFGRRAVFAFGLLVFVVGSILCGAAQTMPMLILFRAVQGIGAGALTPVTFTIIGDLYPGEERAKIQGVFASVWSVAGLLGPLVGGYFVDQISWRWIFYMNVPVGIIAFILVFGFLHESFEKKSKSIDYGGALLFTVAITSLLYALLSGGEAYPWSSPVIVTLFVIAAILLLLFVWVENKAKEPMLPLTLFRSRRMSIPYTMGFLGFCITAGVTIYTPIWIQTLLGQSATNSGLMLMPMSIAWPIAANLSGRFMYKLGAKAFMVSGAVILAAGGLCLTFLQSGSPFWFIVLIVTIMGFGMGCMTTPSMVLIQTAVGWQMRGVATSTYSLMNAFGQTVGVAVFGTLFNSAIVEKTPAHLANGMHMVFVLIFVIALANVIALSVLPSSRKLMEQQPSA
jgi:EmrB/QacA subfamily drug resistance transporter